ncbi:MAG: TonB-dependent receptor [Gammaproteobacteria bacterium]|nr:TonB-dependent receptor [Gammaproteobacteria bacterium]
MTDQTPITTVRPARNGRMPLHLAIAAALGITLPLAAAAQDQAVEEVIVTGSRIQQSGMQTPVPVTVVDAGELEAMAPGTLVEGISRLPQFFGNQTPASNDGWFVRGGYGNLNLRGLGINRTLTLLDGRRMISSTAFGGVDINVFPEAMIERVETVTGGASAAYGTDAVAGVTNFILDTDYTGFRTHVQGGQTSRGDSDNYELSVSFGTEIGERGHLLVSGERFDQDGVYGYEDRDWYQGWGTIPDANGMLLIRPRIVSRNSSFDGLIFAPGTSLNGLQFHPDGSFSPFELSDTTFSPAPQPVGIPPARQSVVNGGSGDDLGAEVATLMPDSERDSVFLYFDYDVGDNLTLYAQAIRGSNETSRYNAPRGSLQGTPTAITIFQDNAFLPEEIRQTMIAEGIPSFTLKRMGSREDIGADIRLWDESEMLSFTGGFSLELSNGGAFDGWLVEGYYQRGDNERKWYQHGLRVDRIHAAVDAVDNNGEIVCRTTLASDYFADCEPLNLFGRGNASPEAVDWVVGNDPGEAITTPLFFADTGFDLGIMDSYVSQEAKVNITEMDQQLFELTANGQVAEGWAGPVSLALGVSYREEEIQQIVRDSTNRSSDHTNGHPVLCDTDPLAIEIGLRGVSQADCLNTVGIQYSKVSNIMGDLSVSEAFAETFVPLVADRRMMDLMTLGLAARWADYSGSGSIWAWKAGLDMQITQPFRFRATKSRDVRAANLSERFDKTGGIATIDDPRYGETYNVTRFSGGNPAVRPEEADTITAGFVYQPAFADGLSISYDWYQVDIAGAIGQLGTQAVINRCEEGAADLCQLVTRSPTDDRLILVGDVFVNIDQAKVRGRDLEIAYDREVSWLGGNGEAIQTRLFASWLDENSQTLAGTTKIDRAGQTGIEQSTGAAYQLPDFKAIANLTYRTGPFTAFLQGRYIGSGIMEAGLVEGVDIESNKVDSAFYTDFRFSYTRDLRGGANLEVFGNVNNLLDEDPPVTPYYSVFLGYALQTNSGLFDLLGRTYVAGLRLSF